MESKSTLRDHLNNIFNNLGVNEIALQNLEDLELTASKIEEIKKIISEIPDTVKVKLKGGSDLNNPEIRSITSESNPSGGSVNNYEREKKVKGGSGVGKTIKGQERSNRLVKKDESEAIK
jgi:hypothetical protein